MNQHKLYGLGVLSEFELTELEKTNDDDFDVLIKKGRVDFDAQHSRTLFQDVSFTKKNDLFQLSVNEIADYEVRNGNEIRIDLKTNTDLNEFKIFLYGTCFAALLLQNKTVCLHGAGIVKDGKANLFLGYSGMGKSTLTSYFIKQGYQFLGDDVLPLKFDQNQQVQVGTSVPTIKLWEDNLLNLGVTTETGVQIRTDVPKFRYAYRSQLAEGYFPIGRIFVLNWSNDSTALEWQVLSTIESLFYFREHIYRPQFIDQPDEMQLMLDLITSIATNHQIILINGKKTFESLSKIENLL
jgi:hypothetical protein